MLRPENDFFYGRKDLIYFLSFCLLKLGSFRTAGLYMFHFTYTFLIWKLGSIGKTLQINTG